MTIAQGPRFLYKLAIRPGVLVTMSQSHGIAQNHGILGDVRKHNLLHSTEDKVGVCLHLRRGQLQHRAAHETGLAHGGENEAGFAPYRVGCILEHFRGGFSHQLKHERCVSTQSIGSHLELPKVVRACCSHDFRVIEETLCTIMKTVVQ